MAIPLHEPDMSDVDLRLNMSENLSAEAQQEARRITVGGRVAALQSWGARQRELTVFATTAVLFTGLAIFVPEFFTASNLIELLRQIATTGIIAVAMTFLIIAG